MKKALIASTALVLTAGVAAADVTISGYGRTGIIYYENDDSNVNETQVISRLRMNIDAATSTDQGVDFGARFRLQWDQNRDNSDERGNGGTVNAGKLYVTASGLTVEVGNVDTAYDSNGLLYATELGSYDRSVGFSDVTGNFFSYHVGRYDDNEIGRMGVRAVYAVGDLEVQASYVDPDQRVDNSFSVINPVTGETEVFFPNADLEEEFSISVDYVWNERLELSAAAAWNGGGIDGNDIFFLGARYAVMENARIGLNYVDTNDADDADFGSVGRTIALYGDYTLADGLTNIEAYVANNDGGEFETDTAYGIGVNYDLGGARLGASLQRDYNEDVTADMGVRFDF